MNKIECGSFVVLMTLVQRLFKIRGVGIRIVKCIKTPKATLKNISEN